MVADDAADDNGACQNKEPSMSSKLQATSDSVNFSERSQVLSAAELERYRDAEWALHDPEVNRRYNGQWLVAFERKVIAHGTDPDSVLAEARRVAGGWNHRLVLCVAPADNWLAHTSDTPVDFAHG
jgi:hypothetical protein